MSDDWYDLLVALLEAEARFLVVGAHAMAVHGVPRGTQDLDVWIDPHPANTDRVWRALAAFGAPLASLGITRDDLQRPGTVVQLGLPPNRIDLLTSISGIPNFATTWPGRVEHAVRDHRVPFLGRDALLRNKRASARRKDLADVEALGEDPGEPPQRR
ncbi:MAG: hypothetical protein WKG32_05570 [Gemmatimonadaceae bacterium]